jgi:hypothetical protein
MSRGYEIAVEIEDFDACRENEITTAADNEWNFSDWNFSEHTKVLSGSGRSNLCGGESEREFAERVTKAIWRANKGFCKVGVTCTYLDELPYSYYEIGKDEFDPTCLTGDDDDCE